MRKLLFLSTLLFTVFSCYEKRKQVDVSKVSIDFRFYRFDKDLLSLKNPGPTSEINLLAKKYGVFLNRYVEGIIQIGSLNRPDFGTNISAFLNDANIQNVYADVQKEFEKDEDLQKELKASLTLYHHYFPDRVVPHIATFISGFNYPIAVTDSVLGIGLDMYMGSNYQFYKLLSLPNYQTLFMSRNHIVSDAISAWLQTEFETNQVHQNLLNEIVYQGKLMYAAEYLMPEAEDSIRLKFSAKQLDWLKNSEQSIWKFFIEKNLFYSSKPSENVKYINPAPFTAGMPKESPGRVGVWLGYKIVSAYMEQNPKFSLNDLMTQSDAQMILNRSHYKPNK